MKSATEIRDWMINYLADNLRIERASIDANRSLDDFGGFNSILAVQMAGALQDYVGFKLPPNMSHQYPTINALSQALVDPSVPK